MLNSYRWKRLPLRRRSGKAALIAVIVAGLALVVGGGLYYANRMKEPPKMTDGPALSPEQEAASQAAGEANLGNKEAGGAGEAEGTPSGPELAPNTPPVAAAGSGDTPPGSQ